MSAFAFQGTNAHAVLYRHTSSQGASGNVSGKNVCTALECGLPRRPHPLLASASASGRGSRIVFSLGLSSAKNAFFFDHQVLDRVLFPGAGFLEAAAGALVKLGADDCAVSGVSIVAPLVMDEVSSTEATVTVVPSENKVSIGSNTTRSAHVVASYVKVLSGPLAASSFSTVSTVSTASSVQTSLGGRMALARCMVAPPATCVGSVVHRVGSRFTYLGSDPAAVDSSFHLSAIELDSAQAFKLKVPTAIGAYMSQPSGPDGGFASCTAEGAATEDAKTSSFVLSSGAGGYARVSSMIAKSFGGKMSTRTSKKDQETAAPSDVASSEYFPAYQLAWEADALGTSRASLAPAHAASTVVLQDGDAFESCASAVSLLQTCPKSVFVSSTVGNLDGLRPDKPSSSLNQLYGLTKSMHLEDKSRSFAIGMDDTTSSMSKLSFSDAAPAGSPYGSVVQDGVTFKPVLDVATSTREVRSMGAYHLMPLPRGAMSNLKAQPVDTSPEAGNVVLEVSRRGHQLPRRF